jgi:hypothetical protein
VQLTSARSIGFLISWERRSCAMIDAQLVELWESVKVYE